MRRQQQIRRQAQPIINQLNQYLAPIATLRPKLIINAPGDIYEQEADRVAEQVLRMPAPDAMIQRAPIGIQRCAKCGGGTTHTHGTCSACAAKAHQEDALLQRAAISGVPAVTPQIEASIGALRGGGQPLDASVRGFMEPRFGHDFSNVRIHTDSHAAETAQSVSALAFAVGRDVVFGAGQYQPGTDAGKRLIAHELTHVVQQGQLHGQTVSQIRPQALQRQDTYFEDRYYSEDCSKYTRMQGIKSCEFYQCREANAEYAGLSNGYYIKYGLKYCELFSELKPQLSDSGKRWVDRTRRLLMQYVHTKIPWEATPEEVRRAAFFSHPDCYVRGGICTLPPSDWWVIVTAIDYVDHDLKQTVTTASSCLGSFAAMGLPATSLNAGGGYGGLMERDRREVFGF